MKSVTLLLKEALIEAAKKQYDHIEVAVDLHGTLIDTELYNKWDGTPEEKFAHSVYTESLAPLVALTKHKSVKVFLYSATRVIDLLRIKMALERMYGIEVSLNSSVSTTTKGQDFDRKPYFSVLFDNKAGFDPKSDWAEVEVAIKSLPVI